MAIERQTQQDFDSSVQYFDEPETGQHEFYESIKEFSKEFAKRKQTKFPVDLVEGPEGFMVIDSEYAKDPIYGLRFYLGGGSRSELIRSYEIQPGKIGLINPTEGLKETSYIDHTSYITPKILAVSEAIILRE